MVEVPVSKTESFPYGSILKTILPLIVTAAIWIWPVPAGIEPRAWHMLAIFIGTILALILGEYPMSVVALAAGAIASLTGVVSLKSVTGSIGTNLVWLILLAFFISRGIIKSGIGRRVALSFIRILGKRTLGLGYGMALSDLILAPAMPSITARAGGVILPIARSIAEVYDSHPEDESRQKLGSYLIQSAFQTNIITGAMFITAMAGNPLAVQLAGAQGIEITWAGWALAASVPGLISLAVTPLVVFYLH